MTLAIAVQRLAQRGVLVKKLAMMETLGTVSVVCTDKSGTLTQNQMTIREVWVAGQRLTVSGVGYEPHGEVRSRRLTEPALAPDLEAAADGRPRCATTPASTRPRPTSPTWTCLGDQTEAALRVLARKGGLDDERLAAAAAARPRTALRRPAQAHDHAPPRPDGRGGLRQGRAARGAAAVHLDSEAAAKSCRSTRRRAASILAANDEYARNALRVLALARRPLPARAGGVSRAETVEQRADLPGAGGDDGSAAAGGGRGDQRCREAGIRMVMITGDYGLTAESVARRIGMLDHRSAEHPDRRRTGSR